MLCTDLYAIIGRGLVCLIKWGISNCKNEQHTFLICIFFCQDTRECWFVLLQQTLRRNLTNRTHVARQMVFFQFITFAQEREAFRLKCMGHCHYKIFESVAASASITRHHSSHVTWKELSWSYDAKTSREQERRSCGSKKRERKMGIHVFLVTIMKARNPRWCAELLILW